MIAQFNDSVKKIARVTYSQQIGNMIENIGNSKFTAENIAVTAVNFLISAILFGAAYKKISAESTA